MRTTILPLLLPLLLFRLSLQDCNIGCLECDTANNRCKLCDFVNFYQLDTSTASCKLHDTSVSNCQLLSIEYTCVECKKDHYMDSSSNLCKPMSEENLVENCLQYNSDTECSACVSGFVVLNNQCLKSETEIANCAVYKTALHCHVCNEGYIPSLDETVCRKVPLISNCALFSFVDCVNCKSGYVSDKSLYLYSQGNYMDAPGTRKSVENYLLASSGKTGVTFSGQFSTICDVERVGDCLDFANPFVCRKCKENFLVNTAGDVCLPFPETPIANCIEYSQVDQCLVCKDNYYVDIDDPSKCKKGEEIDFCIEYAVNEPLCVKCQENYFIDGKECVIRVNSLIAPGCILKGTHSDNCFQCQEGFALLATGKCISGILNCLNHVPGASSLDDLSCEQCKDTFYFKTDTSKCVSGSDSLCRVYKSTEDECQECKAGTYLSVNAISGTNVCLQHTQTVDNCEAYSILTENQCTQCSASYLLFQNRNFCESTASPISRCVVYESPTTCRVCEDHFHGNNCDSINSNLKCKKLVTGSTTKCQECKDGYYTNKFPFDNNCKEPYESMSETCENFILPDFSSRILCNMCKAAKLPIIFDESENFLCVDSRDYPSLDEYCDLWELNSSTGAYTCKMCREGRVLAVDGTCQTDCGASEFVLKLNIDLDKDDNFYRLSGRDICVDDTSFPNCKIAAQTLSTAPGVIPGIVCAECKAGFSEVIPIGSDVVRTHNWDKAASAFVRFQHNPEVLCKTITTSDLSGTTDSNDCDKFYELKTTPAPKYGCAKCNLGKTGKVVFVADTTLPISPIQVMEKCDQTIEFCLNTESDWRGITRISQLVDEKQKLSWENLFTCFKCFGSDTRIPFINFVWDSTRKVPHIKAYNLDKIFLTNDVTDFSVNDGHDPKGFAMSCKDYKIPADFGVDPVNTPAFISNCAIGGFNLKGTDTDSRVANAFAVCLVCAPGYSPIFLTDSFIIIECAPISSCGTSLIMNECTFCLDNKIYDKDDNSCITQDNYDPHCHFGTQTECYICEPGYVVNLDKVCEQLDAPNCEPGYSFLPLSLRSDNLGLFMTISSRLSYGGGADSSGCGKCETGFIGISNLPLVSTMCLNSSYLATDEFPNTTNYIPDCLKLSYSYETDGFICGQCKSGFMPSWDLTRCVVQTSFCLHASITGDSVCNLCKDGYSLVNGKCQQNKITDCAVYYTDSVNIFCKECLPGFVKDPFDLKCTAGEIPKCSKYRLNDALHCLECESGYKLIRNNLGRTICLDALQLNCDIWEDDNDFFCTQCKDSFNPKVIGSGDVASSCIGGNFSIENCQALDSEFACALCNEGFYLSKSRDRCIALASPLLHCETPLLDEPECKTCETGYYLKEDTRKCFPFPSGISNCVDYQNESVCSKCADKFYLSENQCKEVTEPILNCISYVSNTICGECKAGYSINPEATGPDNTCALIRATDCLTTSDINTCSSCASGKGLVHSNTSVDCKSVTPVPLCDQQDFNEPYKCLVCSSNSVFKEGNCEAIINPILYCTGYYSQTACKVCKSGYLLKSDGSACEKIGSDFEVPIDANCDSFLQDSRGFGCNACQPGYYLAQGGVCFPVSSLSDEHKGNDHCAFFTDINKLKCQICSSGYNMDQNGVCLKNTSIPDESSRPTTPTDDKSIGVIAMHLMMLVGFLGW